MNIICFMVLQRQIELGLIGIEMKGQKRIKKTGRAIHTFAQSILSNHMSIERTQ